MNYKTSHSTCSSKTWLWHCSHWACVFAVVEESVCYRSLFLNLDKSVIHSRVIECRRNDAAWLLRWGHSSRCNFSLVSWTPILGALGKGAIVLKTQFSKEASTSSSWENTWRGLEIPQRERCFSYSRAAPAPFSFSSDHSLTATTWDMWKLYPRVESFRNSWPTNCCCFKPLYLGMIWNTEIAIHNRFNLYKWDFSGMERSDARIVIKWVHIFNFSSF